MKASLPEGLWEGDQILLNDRLWRVARFEGIQVHLESIPHGVSEARSINDLFWDPTFLVFTSEGTDSLFDVLSAAGSLNVRPSVMTKAITLARHLEELDHGVPFLPDERPPATFKPRSAYRPGKSMASKFKAKLKDLEGGELACSLRQLERHLSNYRKHGFSGLIPKNQLVKQVRPLSVDARFLEVLATELDREVAGPERGADAILMTTNKTIAEGQEYSDVAVPSLSSQKRYLKQLQERIGYVPGQRRKYLQSAMKRPKRTHRLVDALMPGERIEVDTTILNVMTRDPLTGREYRPYLSVALDVATRCIVGLVVSSYEDHSIMPRLMLDAMTPKPAVEARSVRSYANRLGVHPDVLFSTYPGLPVDAEIAEGPLVRPRTVVMDQGKPYYNRQVLWMLGRLGAAVELARPASPTDKPHVERFFKTLESLLMGLPGYVGKDVASGGKRPRFDSAQLLTDPEVETVLRAWIAMVYHQRRHSSLHVPVSRGRMLQATPMEMYALLIEQHGFLPAPLNRDLRYLAMDVRDVTIQDDGIHINNLVYDSPDLDHVRRSDCPWSRNGKWPVHFDPMDCRNVHLLLPFDGDRLWVDVPWKHQPPAMRHPFPFRVMEFVHTYRPESSTTSMVTSWREDVGGRQARMNSRTLSHAAGRFLDWAARAVSQARRSGDTQSDIEMRAIRAWAENLADTHLVRLEKRYLPQDAVASDAVGGADEFVAIIPNGDASDVSRVPVTAEDMAAVWSTPKAWGLVLDVDES